MKKSILLNHQSTIKLNGGERKEVSEENTEKEVPILPDGDLYPAKVKYSGLNLLLLCLSSIYMTFMCFQFMNELAISSLF